MANFEISLDPARIDFQRVSDMLKSTYWGRNRSDDIHRQAFANSICVSAFADDRQVGFARASGDRVLFARLSDVIVWPDFRGIGIGRSLVESLLHHPELEAVSTWTLGTNDAQGLYVRFGFRPVDGAKEMRLDR